MTQGSAAIADAAARASAVQTPGSVLVQAPAGSGKTTLLAQRYLRLLATVDAPEHILALTFTRRAAEEMRARVIRALGAGGLAQCPADFNRYTWELAADARRHLLGLGIDLERHPSRLRIETIDSFNAWLAAQLPITSGAGGRLTLIDQARPLYEEAARRTLQDPDDNFAAAVERVLAVGDQRWSQLVELIVEMLPQRDRWLPLLVGRLHAAVEMDETQLAHVRAHFDEDLGLLVSRELDGAHRLLGGERLAAIGPCLRAAARNLGSTRPEFVRWQTDPSPLGAALSDLARWRAVATVLLTGGNKIRKRVDKTLGFPPACAEKGIMQSLLEELERSDSAADIVAALCTVRDLPEPRYEDADWERVRDVAQVLVLASATLEGVFREKGTVDFPAVSMTALRALGTAEAPTDLSLRLDYRLQHLLLDEFQDTSAAQLDLVQQLTAGWQRGDGRSVFCVGDPMQSIYGFRQAEVRAFLDLAEDGLGAVQFEVERLSCNFRSDPLLVTWVNRCFERILPLRDDRDRGAIAFRPSTPAVSRDGEREACVSLRGFASVADEATAVARTVAECRERHPAWRIAILVRARTHAREIAHALRARGIVFRAVEIEPLQDRPAVRDAVMLACALLHLGDRVAWLALLRAPWCGLTLRDLLTVARSHPLIWDALNDREMLERLSEEGRSRCERLRRVLDAALEMQTHTRIARWIERTWLALGGPGCARDARELDQVRAVFARLRELEQQGLPDSAALARSFADLYADDGGECGVEIMTIHKAKGLEFDCVIVPALHRHNRVAGGPMLLMHPFARRERDGLVMAARPPVADRDNRRALFAFLRRQASEAARLEAERLLYVACTRAKHQLHLTATVGLRVDPDWAGEPIEGMEDAEEPPSGGAPPADGTKPWAPFKGSLLRVLWPTQRESFAVIAADPAPAAVGGGAAPPEDLAGLRGGPLRRVPRGWAPRRHAPLQADLPLGAAAREEPVVFDWAGESARRVGILVHAELQRLDLSVSDEATIRSREGHFRRWLALHGVPDEHLAGAVASVTAALLGVHGDPRARWIFKTGYRDDLREHALSGVWRGEVVRAVFDRSFIDEQGTRWVIDYKTSEHSGGGREAFLDLQVARYRAQLERYAVLARRLGPEPVRVALYFPLLRAWREWAPPE
jgi:ATP-dependent exoDNAse (exonuclease V) beta subunit